MTSLGEVSTGNKIQNYILKTLPVELNVSLYMTFNNKFTTGEWC